MTEPFVLPVIELDNGICVNAKTRLNTDWASIKVLVESGVSPKDAAEHFKISVSSVKQRMAKEKWLTPSRVESLRKEIGRKQSRVFLQSGKAADVSTVKAEIWQERGEALREKTFNIVSAALGGVTEEAAKKMIKNPKGLLEIVTATRLVTGEEKADAQEGQKVAINIGFLRSHRPTDVIEAEMVDA
jgi:hypothetical protein